MFFFDEVKQHDDVTDDYTDETHNPEKRHEAKRLTHDPQRRQRSNHAKRYRREHDDGLSRFLELNHQRHEDHHHRNREHDDQLLKALHLVLFLAADLQSITDRQFLLQLLQLRPRRGPYFRSESAVGRHRRNRDGPKLIARTHLLSLHAILELSHLPQMNLLRSLCGIDVKVLQIA